MRHKARRDGISAQEVPAGLCAQQSLSPAGRRAVLALQSSLQQERQDRGTSPREVMAPPGSQGCCTSGGALPSGLAQDPQSSVC